MHTYMPTCMHGLIVFFKVKLPECTVYIYIYIYIYIIDADCAIRGILFHRNIHTHIGTMHTCIYVSVYIHTYMQTYLHGLIIFFKVKLIERRLRDWGTLFHRNFKLVHEHTIWINHYDDIFFGLGSAQPMVYGCCMYVCICMYVCVYVNENINTVWINDYDDVFFGLCSTQPMVYGCCMHACMYVCMYAHIYIYTYIHTHIHI
jgi:hypothetical protein